MVIIVKGNTQLTTKNMNVKLVHLKAFFVSSVEFCKFNKFNKDERKDNRDNRTGGQGNETTEPPTEEPPTEEPPTEEPPTEEPPTEEPPVEEPPVEELATLQIAKVITCSTIAPGQEEACSTVLLAIDPNLFDIIVQGNNPNPSNFEGSSNQTDVKIDLGNYAISEFVDSSFNDFLSGLEASLEAGISGPELIFTGDCTQDEGLHKSIVVNTSSESFDRTACGSEDRRDILTTLRAHCEVLSNPRLNKLTTKNFDIVNHLVKRYDNNS